MDTHAFPHLSDYLGGLAPEAGGGPAPSHWYKRLGDGAAAGREIYSGAHKELRRQIDTAFRDLVRTEEVKAWYGEPENGSLFQGTSVSALTVPCELPGPLRLDSMGDLEEAIADHYIDLHDRHKGSVEGAILENIDKWISEGLYFGVVLGAKVVSQAFGLTADAGDVVFPVLGEKVDPHEITSYAPHIREKYFEACRKKIACFKGIADLTRAEFESSLVLADISKPHIEDYTGKILLAPIRCNEICSMISRNVTRLIREKSQGRISPRSLSVTIYDTDTPYTYHQVMGYFGKPMAPMLPGLTVLGTSGTMDAFRWLYAYRVSLVAQKIMKSSLYSEVARKFVPFVYFGVLVERDAEILLDLDRLGDLRYRGNLSPYLEFCYLVPKIVDHLAATSARDLNDELKDCLR